MDTIESEHWSWALLKDKDSVFYLSVVCGSVGLYEINFKLTKGEVRLYKAGGTKYLKSLAQEVNNNTKFYMQRNIINFIKST